MPSESDLRAGLREPGGQGSGGGGGIDTEAVIRRARSRRRPRQLLVGAVSALAVVGLAVPVVAAVAVGGLGGPGATTAAGGSAEQSATDEDTGAGDSAAPLLDPDGTRRAPAEKLNLCTGTLAEVAPAASGLVATVEFPAGATVGASVDGVVRLTNTGSAAVSGSTGARPAITVAQDGVVLWHSNGPTIMTAVAIDLAPGTSMSIPASFEPLRCGVEDDSAESFHEGLPALAPGVYDISAALDVTLDSPASGTSSEAAIELVTGPASVVALG